MPAMQKKNKSKIKMRSKQEQELINLLLDKLNPNKRLIINLISLSSNKRPNKKYREDVINLVCYNAKEK